MSKKKVLVISPSGSFYGSEQVLFDYLSYTTIVTDVAVPADSTLYSKLTEKKNAYSIRTFQQGQLPRFFLRLAFNLLLNRYQSVYLNEAGPAKYILMLAKFFRRKKFVVHVRIVEDTLKERWLAGPPQNVSVVTISKYIAEKVHFSTTLLYDPFPFSKSVTEDVAAAKAILTVGIIGRITYTKGLIELLSLLQLIKERGLTDKFNFKLFGTMSDDAKQDGVEDRLKQFGNVTLAGFVSPKSKIYDGIDCVLHLASAEPLGRIFLEAIDTGKPFIGINSGGIGEIAAMLGIEHLMADPATGNISQQLVALLEQLRNNYQQGCTTMVKVKGKAAEVFNLDAYTSVVDKLLLS